MKKDILRIILAACFLIPHQIDSIGLREGIKKKIDFFLGKSPKLWAGGGQPFDVKDWIWFMRCTRSKFDDAGLTLRLWGAGGQTLASN